MVDGPPEAVAGPLKSAQTMRREVAQIIKKQKWAANKAAQALNLRGRVPAVSLSAQSARSHKARNEKGPPCTSDPTAANQENLAATILSAQPAGSLESSRRSVAAPARNTQGSGRYRPHHLGGRQSRFLAIKNRLDHLSDGRLRIGWLVEVVNANGFTIFCDEHGWITKPSLS